MKQLLDDEEAAEYLGISLQTLRKLVEDGEFETVSISIGNDYPKTVIEGQTGGFFLVDHLENYVGRRLRQLKRAARDDENWNKK